MSTTTPRMMKYKIGNLPRFILFRKDNNLNLTRGTPKTGDRVKITDSR